ncbi:MAG: hypothetical protein RMX59_034675, partial [Nostoc sp. DedSLP05]
RCGRYAPASLRRSHDSYLDSATPKICLDKSRSRSDRCWWVKSQYGSDKPFSLPLPQELPLLKNSLPKQINFLNTKCIGLRVECKRSRSSAPKPRLKR